MYVNAGSFRTHAAAARRLLFAAAGLFAAFGPAAAQAAPAIQHWVTTNGARVYFVPAPELPIVDVRVVFDAGSAKDGDKAGLATLTNGLLEEGAGRLDADEIAERFEGLGASFGNDAQRDMALVSLRSLTERSLLDPALDTLALVLSEPSFPADAFERERRRMLIGLRAEQESPDAIASKAFFKAMYRDHPYGSPTNGTEQSVTALKRDDIAAFYKRHYVGRNATVAIVGALDRKGAERLAQRVVGKLPAGTAAPAVPPVPPLAAAHDEHIDFPSEQTHILQGQPALTRLDPDYFPLYVGNHILGGSGLISRISEEVREKRGLSYSAYSYFIPMRAAGPFIAGLQTRNAEAEQALAVLRDTLRRFIEQGPSEAELVAAKKNITGGFPLRLDSNSKIVENLAVIGFYKLPLDYLDTFNRRVDAVTAAQIRDAFKRRIDPARMATVLVGTGVATARQP